MKKIVTLISILLLINVTRSSAQAWTSMGGGLGSSSEEIKAIAVDPSGTIYVGGTFTGSVSNFAMWNGSSWVSVGTGINGPVYSIAIKTASEIYVGGQFTIAGGVTVSNVAKWNGTVWSAVGDGFNGKVLCVSVPPSGNVYAGGEFSLSGTTPIAHIAKLDGGIWTAMGSGIPSNVNAITEHTINSVMNVYAANDQANSPVMKFDGVSTWSNCIGLTGGKALTLASFGTYLYAGGDFSQPTRAGARWDGSSWSTIITAFSFGQKINVIYKHTDALYIGGNFTGVGIGSPNYIARVPSTNSPLMSFTVSSELTGGEVLAIAKPGGKVIAGGKFTTPTSPSTLNISQTSTTIDVNEINGVILNKSLYPNPVRNRATLTINTAEVVKNPVLKIFDVQSKLIQSEITLSHQNEKLVFEFDLAHVPSGNYYYVLTDDGNPLASDVFIVE